MEKLNLFLEPLEELTVIPVNNKQLLTLSKGDLLSLASEIIQNVNDGILDGVDVKIFAKKGETFFKALNESLKGKVSLPQEKDYKKHGCNLSVKNTGVKYSYVSCNHPYWNELNFIYNDTKTKLDAIQAKLKFLKAEQEFTDEETGETFIVQPPVKTGGQSIVVTIEE